MDELMASGALDGASLPAGHDDIQAALEAASGAGGDIDRRLAALKAAQRQELEVSHSW